MDPSVDPYRVLGVPRNCTYQQVRKIFRARVSQHHPDRGGDEQQFILICAAYKHIVADLDRAHEIATNEQVASQNMVDFVKRVAKHSDAPITRSQAVISAGLARRAQRESGALIAGIICLTIFVAEDFAELLNFGAGPAAPAAASHSEFVFAPPMARVEYQRGEPEQTPARTTSEPAPESSSRVLQSHPSNLFPVPHAAGLVGTPADRDGRSVD
jgi:hypothetical protein